LFHLVKRKVRPYGSLGDVELNEKSGHCESCASLFFKFSSSCFTWSKERFDHMVALLMLSSTKNQAICNNVKVLGTILQVKFAAMYIMNSSSTSAYKMCKAFMSHFTCPGVATIKIKWMLIWRHNLKNELANVGKTNIGCWHFVVLF